MNIDDYWKLDIITLSYGYMVAEKVIHMLLSFLKKNYICEDKFWDARGDMSHDMYIYIIIHIACFYMKSLISNIQY